MLTDKDKKAIIDLVVQHRPDLKKELLNKDSFIYDRIESYLETNKINEISSDILEKAWIEINLENPIPDLTSEIDVLFEEHFSSLKKELSGLAIYTNVLIELAERKDIIEVYNKYNYFDSDFTHSNQFSNDLLTVISTYIEAEGY